MACISRIWSGVACLGLIMTAPAHADFGDQLAKLLASDGEAGDNFGVSVAIGGPLGNEVAIVGATFWVERDVGYQEGSAYLFDVRSGVQIAQLIRDDADAGDTFGSSVAIVGGMAIVGADGVGPQGAGAVYLFDIGTGEALFRFVGDDTGGTDRFGNSVAVSGDTLIIGARGDDTPAQDVGSAYLFDIPTRRQLAKLQADDGAMGDTFGRAVAISGNTAIVGAYHDDDNGDLSGSAYLFDITDASTPVQIAKLLPDDGAAQDLFGWSVAISGTTAIVGAHQNSNENGFQAGSAYLFDAATGQQIAKILAPGPSFYFGYSVALSGATAIVGHRPAYLFDISDPANPAQIGKLEPEDDPGSFGAPVALSGATAIVGANGDEDNGDGAGAAYLFEVACACDDPEVCDCNNNGVFDACDIADGTSDDCNGNGVPDECDIDCNGNGIPDRCDIADGTSNDCNGNGVPDECDGVMGDLNDDGVVGTIDLLLLISNWGRCANCDDCYADGDIDCDCTVGTLDLIILLGNWG